MDLGALAEYRSERDEFFARHYASPLPEELQESFAGLDWFGPDQTIRMVGRRLPDHA